MAVIEMSSYPILVELIHNGTPTGTVDNGWGDLVNVYQITSIHALERAGSTWTVYAVDEAGKNYTATINPLQDVTLSIPKPKQFSSTPLSFSLTFVPG